MAMLSRNARPRGRTRSGRAAAAALSRRKRSRSSLNFVKRDCEVEFRSCAVTHCLKRRLGESEETLEETAT